jgi:hypothetical protein
MWNLKLFDQAKKNIYISIITSGLSSLVIIDIFIHVYIFIITSGLSSPRN